MRKPIATTVMAIVAVLGFAPLSMGAVRHDCGHAAVAVAAAKEKCGMCGGKGKVVPTCSKCRGTGKGQGFDTTMMGKCTKCKGKPLPKVKCDFCNGKGKI
jgi:DnaJ-class molecular chaperone